MFTLLISGRVADGGDLEALARAWFTELPPTVAPGYWAELERALPLDPELMRREMPAPWETQAPSGRPYASVTVAPRPWRAPRARIYSPRRLESVLDRLHAPETRPLYSALHLGTIDTDDIPIPGGGLTIKMTTGEQDPGLATLAIYREESLPGEGTFPDTILDACAVYLKTLCRTTDLDFAGVGDAAYVHNHTYLDEALRRDPEESARDAREWLRGYAWITVVPRELAARLGGADALAATGAFHEVEELPHGGVWLRATEREDAYDAAAVRRVFQALAPVLPPGRPELTEPDTYAWQIIAEDADAYR